MKKIAIPDIDELYSQDLKEENGQFVCPVCDKPYKSKSAAQKHLEKQECADYKTIYLDTVHEKLGYDLYKYTLAEFNPNTRTSFLNFRKSNSYNPVMRLYTFLAYKSMIQHWEFYISWLKIMKKVKHPNQLLKAGVSEKDLHHFKLDCHAMGWIDTKSFENKYFEDFFKDKNFFVLSLERCNLGVIDVLDSKAYDGLINGLPVDLKDRVFELVGDVVERKKKLRKG